MEETEKIQPKLANQEIDYFKIGRILLSRWYWVAGSVIICTIVANMYLWYTPKTYATSSTLKFEEKKSEIPDLAGGTSTSDRGNVSKIQSETIVLQSATLLLNAIKHIDYHISFFVVGRVLNRTSELYPQKPLDIELIRFDSVNFFHSLVTFKPINKSSYSLSYKDSGREIQKNYAYNTPVTLGATSFSISYPGNLSSTASFLFKFNAPEDFIGRVRSGFHTNETSKNSNTISLQETDSNPQFAADILNAIMREYLSYDSKQRKKSTTQMIQFIDSQLDFLSNEVKGSANSIEQYKQNKKIMDVSSATDQAIGKFKELGAQKSLLNIDLIAVDQLKQDIIKGKDNVNLNINSQGIVDPELTSFIITLNNYVDEKNALLKTYNSNSAPIQNMDQQILVIKNNALNAINALRLLIEKKIKYYNDQLAPVNQEIAELPGAQRDLVSLQRNFDINDKVYSFLSEKKLDEQISSAGILPGATIVDLAQPSYHSVSPDEHAIQRSAMIVGLIIGFGLIILIRVLNPYIFDKETVESLTTIPIIGVIRKFPQEIDEYSTQILAISKPKSVFAESVRSVRTNLSFLASEKKKQSDLRYL